MRRLTYTLFSLLILFMTLHGCQQEKEIIILPSSTDVISSDTTAVNLITQTSLYDGSFDNIIDHTSCSAVVLPVTVIANGQEITISSPDDFKYIERIWDESNAGDDSLQIFFPITIILSDHSERTIQNASELKTLADHCHEEGSDDDIECIDFIYPINFSIYNTNNQVGSIVSVNTDSALYEYMKHIEDGLIVSIIFPVKMQQINGVLITVNNNSELKNAISNAKKSCNEDDNNDYEDDDVDSSELQTILLGSSWKVNYFFDKNDLTSEFLNYSFTFSTDGKVVATNGITIVSGVWALYNDSDPLELRIEFNVDSQSPFSDLKDNWKVDEYNGTTITLKDNENEDHRKALTLRKL